MRLILEETSFQFNGKHYLQTHRIAMGTKMAVAFAVIFIAHIEKQLLASSPHEPFLWKRFIDDIFSVWTISEQEINNLVAFALVRGFQTKPKTSKNNIWPLVTTYSPGCAESQTDSHETLSSVHIL